MNVPINKRNRIVQIFAGHLSLAKFIIFVLRLMRQDISYKFDCLRQAPMRIHDWQSVRGCTHKLGKLMLG